MLADGSILETGYGSQGESLVSNLFSYGIGADLKGLFFQSNLGIVLSATIQLQPIQKHQKSFTLAFQEENLGDVMEAIKRLHEEKVIQCIPHVFNRERFLPAVAAVTRRKAYELGISISREETLSLLDRFLPGQWFAVGSLSGNAKIVKASTRVIHHQLASFGKLRFLSDRMIAFLKTIVVTFRLKKVQALLLAMERLKGISQGSPTNDVLHSLSWPVGEELSESYLNPGQGSCGLLYVVPIFPLGSRYVCDTLKALRLACAPFGFSPSISFNPVNARFIEGVVSIEYARNDQEAIKRAKACARAMNEALIQLKHYPYRIDIDHYELMMQPSPFWAKLRLIKNALDPHEILAPQKFMPAIQERRPTKEPLQ